MVSSNDEDLGLGEEAGAVEEFGLPTVTEEAELEIDLDEFEDRKTLTEAEEETPHQTDLQAVLKYLHPKYKDKRLNELLQSAMASRVFPDNLVDKNHLLSVSLIEEYAEAGGDVPVVDIISMVQDAISIGFEGRARVEDLEVAGVAHEEEMEKLSKELGLS